MSTILDMHARCTLYILSSDSMLGRNVCIREDNWVKHHGRMAIGYAAQKEQVCRVYGRALFIADGFKYMNLHYTTTYANVLRVCT